MNTISNKCHTTIHRLPLRAFIDCLIDKDLSGLVISGAPSQTELESAWDDLLWQYSDALAGPRQEYQADLYKKSLSQEFKVRSLEVFVSILEDYRVAEIIDQLSRLTGEKFKFPLADPVAYEKDLKRCRGIIALESVILDQLLRQLNESQPADDQKPTRDYFAKILINLSDDAGYEIRDDISVYTFCERINRYIQKIEQRQTKQSLQWEQSSQY